MGALRSQGWTNKFREEAWCGCVGESVSGIRLGLYLMLVSHPRLFPERLGLTFWGANAAVKHGYCQALVAVRFFVLTVGW